MNPAQALTVLGLSLAFALPAWGGGVPDEANNALLLDGAGFVRVPQHPALNPAEALSLEAWVRHTDQSNCGTIVGRNFGTGYWLGLCPANLRFWVGGVMYEGESAVPLNEWTHVAVTLSAGTLSMYLNGSLDHSFKQPFYVPVTPEDLGIGAEPNGSYGFVGSIGSVRLWDHVRSQDEIRDDMTSQIDERPPGLLAAWELAGTAADMFGSHPGSIIGTAVFTGVPSPAFPTDPLDIPLISGAPTLDGACNDGEYGTLKVPIWTRAEYGVDSPVWARIVATASQLYVCVDRFPVEMTAAAVYLDAAGDGAGAPQTDDYFVRARKDGEAASERGTGAAWGAPGLADFEAHYTYGDILGGAEFRIPRSVLPAADTVFRMQVELNYRGVGEPYDYGWPPLANSLVPNTWPRVRVASTPLRPDGANPGVTWITFDPESPRPAVPMTISVEASDDVDLARIEFFVDTSSPVHTCDLPGSNDTSARCPYLNPAGYALGTHTFQARVTDHRGRTAWSWRRQFLVRVDASAPAIAFHHTPITGGPGEEVAIHATATDAEGIRLIRIETDLATSWSTFCEFPAGTTSAPCSFTFTPPLARSVVRYHITAVDYAGFETETQPVNVVFGNAGPDSDTDGLSDEVERQLCTDPNNPDTDRDSLMDGYEVLGVYFPADATHTEDFTNLPALGANPCVKDLFLQYDYERGARFRQSALDYGVGLFRRNRIMLHLTENERPRPGSSQVSTVTAEQASHMRDDSGDYYFRPTLNWTHQYYYTHHHDHGDGYWTPTLYISVNVVTTHYGEPNDPPSHSYECPLSERDPQRNCRRDQTADTYGFVHEIGHAIGLGHGGRRSDAFYREAGGLIHYGTLFGDFDEHLANFKPNYLSVMNYYSETMYRASHMCFNPTTNSWFGDIDFLHERMPDLDEAALDERPTSDFAAALRSRSCNGFPGYVPVAVYFCRPSNLPPRCALLARLTDGNRTVGSTCVGATMTPIASPHDDGIDWNCDGTISTTPVSEDLNNSGTMQTLVARADWPQLPAGRDCTVGNFNGDYYQPQDYRDQIRGPDCRDRAIIHGPLPTMPAAGFHPAPLTAVPLLSGARPARAPDAAMAAHYDLAPSDRPGFEVDPADLPFWLPSPPELCDGVDNDGNDEIDEGCRDSDKDNVIDVLDNCENTYNPDQADADGDGLGEACGHPTLSKVAATENPDHSVTLEWNCSTTDVMGFAIYRLEPDGTSVYLGTGYPSTATTSFTDQPDTPVGAAYRVLAVNRNGVEAGAVDVVVPGDQPTATPTNTTTPVPTETPTISPTAEAQPCAGDCDRDGQVTVAEIVHGVGIALGIRPAGGCDGVDGDGNGIVPVDELVAAVRSALHGCAKSGRSRVAALARYSR